MIGIWNSVINYFIHDSDKANSIDLRKAKFFIGTLLLGLFISVLNSVYFLLTWVDQMLVLGCLVFLVALLLICFIYKKYGKRVLTVNLFNGFGCPLIVMGAFQYTGGLYSSDLLWLTVFASWAFLVADRLTGYIWFSFSLVVSIVFFIVQKNENAVVKGLQTTAEYELMNNGLACIFLFLILLWNDRNIRTNYTELEKSKQIIEEKQKEILDSIHYAKRIQKSLLPSEKFIDLTLKQKKRST